MNKRNLIAAFEAVSPDPAQKERMLRGIQSPQSKGAMSKRPMRRVAWAVIPMGLAAVIAIVVFLWPQAGTDLPSSYALSIHTGGDAVFKLADSQGMYDAFGQSVSNINARPDLEFYIEGENIAKVEMTCQSEYLYACDWTGTQGEIHDPLVDRAFASQYSKHMVFEFGEGFSDYGEIWYRWTAYDLYLWALEDVDARFQLGGTPDLTNATPEQLLEAASAQATSAGHILLDGYPQELLEDLITIYITDRAGNTTVRTIAITITNNEINQTVVTAQLIE